MLTRPHSASTLIALSLALAAGACAPAADTGTSGSGGANNGSGGSTNGAGGANNGSGGANAGTGGSVSGSGGANNGSGGANTGSGGSSTETGGRSATGGANPGSGGSTTGTGGKSGTGGATGTGGRAATGGSTATGGSSGTGGTAGSTGKFSFFVTSLAAMQKLSGNTKGFGGDLRYGQADGLAGADKICHDIAEMAVPGSGAKTWHAFLSTVAGPVNAKDRVGTGPWYDAKGRLVASTLAQLMMERPGDADVAIKNDLPNEYGIPNHTDGAPGCTNNDCPDNHDTLTGTGTNGMLYKSDMAATCNDWTSAAASGKPWCGHSWPRQGSGVNWMSALAEGGCAPGVSLVEMGPPNAPDVGSGGGYGGIYCFALTP